MGTLTSKNRTSAKTVLVAYEHVMARTWKLCCVLYGAGRVDAYIKLELYESEVMECQDEYGRDIFLYPDQDLHVKPYMRAELGVTD